jgi:hypothetical protein
MFRDYKIILGTIILLFSMQNVQASPVVEVAQNFDLIAAPFDSTGPGTHTLTGSLPDSSDNVLWFSFTLDGPANVSLSTEGSSLVDPDGDDDTLLALYDSTGAIAGQNDDCGAAPEFFSCLDLPLLAGGLYFAGVMNFQGSFEDGFVTTTTPGDGNITLGLTVSAVPVPAAVWLFGTAMIGLVGFGKRRKAA